MIPELTWTCHICKRERPDALIGVCSTDLSEERGLEAGTLKQNVRYCVDSKACREAAITYRFLRDERRRTKDASGE
jgi:hypothetical protein